VRPLWLKKTAYWAAAACLLVAIGLGYRFLKSGSVFDSLYTRQTAGLSGGTRENINDTQSRMDVKLPDGSVVTLAPRSRLSYPADYGHASRKVYLLGEARFDVARNPQKPFFVYSNEVVTKVLGTRFIVRSIDRDPKVTVTVESGHVSVYKGELPTSDKKLDGVLLLPNQQVVFSRKTQTFDKGLVQRPRRLDVDSQVPVSFTFDETPVAEVFGRLEKAFGVTIVYNADLLKECQFTSSLNNESLYLMLDIITQSIGATYETVDAEIVVNADGCKSD
jgi:transmembrane sensor